MRDSTFFFRCNLKISTSHPNYQVTRLLSGHAAENMDCRKMRKVSPLVDAFHYVM